MFGGHHKHHHHREEDEYDQQQQYQQQYEDRGVDDGYQQQRGFPGQDYRSSQGPPPQDYRAPQGGRPQGGGGGGGQYQQGNQQQGYSQMAGPMTSQGYGGPGGPRKKSLLVGINYVGSSHALQGCHQDVNNMREFLGAMGYPSDPRSQVVMRDDQSTDPRGPMYPNGHNLLAAFTWLVSEPGTCNFLHYSGHGGQVAADDDYSASEYDDTIVPVDFERAGQIPSGELHKALVSRLPPNSTLFIVFDCCHSGSAVELPYVYRADENGNVGMMNNLKTGVHLMAEANNLIQGGISMNSIGQAKSLLAGATSFFKGLTHKEEIGANGLGHAGNFEEEYRSEGPKAVWMYSGCKDDQTSADASIAGSHVGAMSWAFLECMKRGGVNQSYVQVLQNTRQILSDRYQQIPQLSVGYEQDLNYQIRI